MRYLWCFAVVLPAALIVTFHPEWTGFFLGLTGGICYFIGKGAK